MPKSLKRVCLLFLLLSSVCSIQEWAKDPDGMVSVKSVDEMKQYVRSIRSSPSPILWLTWVEDASCNASQTIDLQDSIKSAVEDLESTMIPTIRYTISTKADRHYTKATETPALFVTTMNETSRYSIEYSGSYHDIPGTVSHYRDWLTKWSNSIYDDTVPSITLEESKPRVFATKDDIMEYWQSEFTGEGILDPLLLVYYGRDASLCHGRSTSHDIHDEEHWIFEQFAIAVAGRRDRYFFYSRACQRHLHVYDYSGKLLHEYTNGDNDDDMRIFLVQATSDAILEFHREHTAPILMAHSIHVVSMTPGILQPSSCNKWKRRNVSIICMFVPNEEQRLIHTLGLVADRIVVVDADQRTHAQPADVTPSAFVDSVVFQTRDETSLPPPERTGSISWIEQSGIGMPKSGIVVAIARTCGHCQRILAILYRLEGLLETLGWTNRFPLFVVDVTKSDMVQPYWLPALYYNGIESPKRSFQDETDILEWVFGQMKDDEIITLQHSI